MTGLNDLAVCYSNGSGIHLLAYDLDLDKALKEVEFHYSEIKNMKVVRMDEDLSKNFLTAKRGLTARSILRERQQTTARKYFG